MSAFISTKFTGIEHNNCAPEHTRTVRKGSEISLQKPSTLEITNTSGFDLEVLLELNAKSKLTTPFFIRDQFDNQLLSFKFLLPANFVTNIALATHYTKPCLEKDASVRNKSVLSFSLFAVGSDQRVASAQLPLKLLHASAKMRKVMYETLNLSSAGLSFMSSTERSPINSASNVLVAQNLLENQGFSPLPAAFGLVPADEYSNASTASSSPSGQEHGQAVGLFFEEETTTPQSPASSSSAFSFTQGEAPQMMMMAMADNTEFANSMDAPQDMTFSSLSSSTALPHVSLYPYFCLGDENNEAESDESNFYPPSPVGHGCGSFLLTTPFH